MIHCSVKNVTSKKTTNHHIKRTNIWKKLFIQPRNIGWHQHHIIRTHFHYCRYCWIRDDCSIIYTNETSFRFDFIYILKKWDHFESWFCIKSSNNYLCEYFHTKRKKKWNEWKLARKSRKINFTTETTVFIISMNSTATVSMRCKKQNILNPVLSVSHAAVHLSWRYIFRFAHWITDFFFLSIQLFYSWLFVWKLNVIKQLKKNHTLTNMMTKKNNS